MQPAQLCFISSFVAVVQHFVLLGCPDAQALHRIAVRQVLCVVAKVCEATQLCDDAVCMGLRVVNMCLRGLTDPYR